MIFSSHLSLILKLPKLVIFLSLISMLALSLSSIFGSVIYGFQNMKIFLLTDLIGMLAKLFSAILLYLSFKYFAPIIGFLVGYFSITFFRYFKTKLNGKRENR